MPKTKKWIQDDKEAEAFFENLVKDLSKEPRNLTSEEWEKVKAYINEFEIAVEMINACMGFGCGIILHTIDTCGMLHVSKRLACFTQKHLESPDEEEMKYYGSMRFDEAWEVFLPLCDNERNKELLEQFKIRPLRSKSSYEY